MNWQHCSEHGAALAGTWGCPTCVQELRRGFTGLLYELWRDGVLSEQQCAKRYGVDLVTMRRLLDDRAQAAGFSSRGEAQDAQPWKPFSTCCEYVRDEAKSEGLYEAGIALTELQRAVEAILEGGHMNQELLARLRAAYEFGFAPEAPEEPMTLEEAIKWAKETTEEPKP
jgi:hypothetical protein